MKILLASPHGFCAGVVRAIETLEQALKTYGPPLYVYHEIVHNKHVVRQFHERGAIFVESLDQIPDGAIVLFSAHGISPQIRAEARRRLRTIDATCPLVAKVHTEALHLAQLNYTIVLIGHRGHDEVAGALGEAPDRMVLVETPEQAESLVVADPCRVAYLTQTTLSLDDADRIVAVLRRRLPLIRGPRTQDICYATQNRQEAVRELARDVDVVLVLGSRNSSNSIRLVEVARECGKPTYLIDEVHDIDKAWLAGANSVLVTAGASAPENVVWECVSWLRAKYGAEFVERRTREENVEFRLPSLQATPTTGFAPPVLPLLDGSTSSCTS